MIFKAFFKERRIKVMAELCIREKLVELENGDQLKRDIQWALESRVKEEVLKFVETEIDKEICRKIAQDLLKDFQYKPILEKAMLEKFEGYVKGTTAPPMYSDLNNQVLLAQRRGY